MSQRKTQAFLVVPVQQDVALTSIALGIVSTLQRLGVEVGFAKPVAQEINDRSCAFSRQIFKTDSPDSIPLDAVAERIASNQTADLLEDIVASCMKASQNANILVIEGLHADATYNFASQFNTSIANTLKANIILVGNASVPSAITDLRLAIRQFTREGCKVAGVVLNMAPEGFDSEAVKSQLGSTPLWGVVPETPGLQAFRMLDVARHLKAEVVSEGEINTRRVSHVAVAARSGPYFISHLQPGALIITSGDRHDVILSTALAVSRGMPIAGILLTHNSEIDPKLMELVGPVFDGGVPILRTGSDTFRTARRVIEIPKAVPEDDIERMNMVLETVAEHLDTETISASFHIPENTKLSPPAFRYQLIQKARAAGKRIVLPEGDEPRTVRAAAICTEKGIAHCILLGKREAIENVATLQGITLPEGLEIVDPDEIRANYVAPMVELRKSKGLTPDQAIAQLDDTVVLGTMMLAVGDVDGLVSGAVHTTASTVRPALQLIKTAPGSSIVSSVFFMLMPDQVLVYGDCAINPTPTAEQLAEIAKQSSDSAIAFGIQPKVAMISYSTGTSGAGEDVEKVRQATELARAKVPDLVIDGPLQYDAASVIEVGRQKAPKSQVAGQATVFVFPDLNTGNTTYKAVQRSANVVSVGPMLQGLRKPVNDLSRGALVDDIVFTIALTAIQAQAGSEQ